MALAYASSTLAKALYPMSGPWTAQITTKETMSVAARATRAPSDGRSTFSSIARVYHASPATLQQKARQSGGLLRSHDHSSGANMVEALRYHHPVVVTGGAGFLGLEVVRQLRAAGCRDVRVVDLTHSPGRR